MSTYVPSWGDIKAAWSAGWKALADRASSTYASAAQSDPTVALVKVQAFWQALEESRATLDRIAAKLPSPPATPADQQAFVQYQGLEQRYHELAAGFLADATPAPEGPGGTPASPVVGVAPVLILGGLAITVVGVAWAVAAYEYAMNLRDQTALAERELDARIAASQEGRSLAPSTLPTPTGPAAGARSAGLWVVGGLAVLAGALALPLFWKR